MTIVLHWWTLPLVVTAIAMTWGCWPRRSSGGYGPDFGVLFTGFAAIIITLVAWLIGALCK
jgi:hypothetical protein